MKSRVWLDPPDVEPGAIHLWWARIDAQAGDDASVLSAEERSRAERFVRDVDRSRFLGRRSLVRRLLAAYVRREPAALEFATGPHGKPALAARELASWSFNLSHSDDVVLIGVARSRALGVDVEARRLKTDLMGVAQQVFTADELAELSELPDAEARRDAFFRGWTRKEAVLKARGEGFAREPRTFRVGLREAPVGGVRALDAEPELAGYSVADLAAPEGYAACLCAEGDAWRPVVVTAP